MGRHAGSTDAPASERFWRFVTVLHDPAKCWIWQGATANGYGVLNDDNKTQVSAHRFSWALHNGVELPVGKGRGATGPVVAHACDNRRCVNPAHLILTTQKENIRDMVRKGRQFPHNSRKTSCKRGHPFTPGNFRIYNGRRHCIECGNLTRRKGYVA